MGLGVGELATVAWWRCQASDAAVQQIVGSPQSSLAVVYSAPHKRTVRATPISNAVTTSGPHGTLENGTPIGHSQPLKAA